FLGLGARFGDDAGAGVATAIAWAVLALVIIARILHGCGCFALIAPILTRIGRLASGINPSGYCVRLFQEKRSRARLAAARLASSMRQKPSPARAALAGEVAVATRRRLCDSKGAKQSCEGRRGQTKRAPADAGALLQYGVRVRLRRRGWSAPHRARPAPDP